MCSNLHNRDSVKRTWYRGLQHSPSCRERLPRKLRSSLYSNLHLLRLLSNRVHALLLFYNPLISDQTRRSEPYKRTSYPYLLDRPREPPARTHKPKRNRVHEHDPDGDRGVVERLRVDRVRLGEDERDGDEDDPDACGEGDRVGKWAEVEWAPLEAVSVDEAEGYWDTWTCAVIVNVNSTELEEELGDAP